MTTVEILRAARELLSDESRWHKGWLAADAKGSTRRIDEFGNDVYIYANESSACRWCAVGAICKVTDRRCFGFDGIITQHLLDALTLLESEATDLWGFDSVADFNDNPETTHDDILDLFDHAIERAVDRETA